MLGFRGRTCEGAQEPLLQPEQRGRSGVPTIAAPHGGVKEFSQTPNLEGGAAGTHPQTHSSATQMPLCFKQEGASKRPQQEHALLSQTQVFWKLWHSEQENKVWANLL